jgi:hypothetical protein
MSAAWSTPPGRTHNKEAKNDETFWVYQMERRFA